MAWSLKIYPFDELWKILQDSPIVYYQDGLSTPIPYPDFKSNIVDIPCYQSEGQPVPFQLTKDEQVNIAIADSFLSINDYSKARKYAKLVLKSNPKLSNIMDYIARTYTLENNPNAAKKWYRKSISTNFYDIKAHWQLGVLLAISGDIDAAVPQITIAKILNRNEPLVDLCFKNILHEALRDTTDWYFNPQIKVEKTCEDTVKIFADPLWWGYGIHEALWKYEPGFHQNDKKPDGIFDLLYYMEGFESLWDTLVNSRVDLSKHPALNILVQSIPQEAVKSQGVNQLDNFCLEYVNYEIALPNNPYAAYFFPKDEIMKIQRYILELRHKNLAKSK
jgi:tetratricopeptide (TPR) repeat protein